MANQQWTGAYYLTGLAIECAIKACLARTVKEYDYPDRKFVNDMYQHDLQNLVQLDAALWLALQSDMKNDGAFAANWSTIKDWDDQKRYDIVQEQEARGLYNAAAAAAAGSGVMHWIRGKW